MVAKTPTKERRMTAVAVAAFNPNVVNETLRKVDRCMARLEELQYTVAGGRKTVGGVSLSPRSTRSYLRTSVRCKQESLRIKTSNAQKSPVGKFQGITNGDWRRMSLQAMLLDETVLEILNASKFAKEVARAVAAAAAAPPPELSRTTSTDPKTPVTIRRSSNKPSRECTETMQARRAKEKKHGRLKTSRSESSPAGTRAKSRIRFKSNSPLSSTREDKRVIEGGGGGGSSVKVDRVSPRNRPWAKKTVVLFPNPVFLPSSSSSPLPSSRKTFYKTKSPIIARRQTQQTPHKFLIKSPSASLKSQLKSRKAIPAATPAESPPRKAVKPKARRASFSPSKLVNRMVSPLKTRFFLHKSSVGLLSGLKQRPPVLSTPKRVPSIRKSIV